LGIDKELYNIAEDDLRGAFEDIKWNCWRKSIISSCEAGEKYLKSALCNIPHDNQLNTTHSLTWIYSALSKVYIGTHDLEKAVKALSKYVVTARYAMPGMVWTEEMANEFIKYAYMVRDYVNNIINNK
jgi:HEPN domain-containing protein